ncbi:negative elongation factor B-like [Branchiostoma floridae]|uniref:Negative elongation factor B-like n=1 Tax=Branchiostoma floridae TaxID=7739 RepID=C3Y2N3_BRAFL|nr:negative elongation factor B-like [Branchiostoma floridae]|eukprot:XP_002609285.1 hypothetical protein BRAFLDRAFT_124742 [Branchiostoma floridae]
MAEKKSTETVIQAASTTTGLTDLGIPGGEQLREALSTCTDPIRAIQEFQDENSILLPSLKPALPLLDLHSVNRFDFHGSMVERLKDRLMQQVSSLVSERDTDAESKAKLEAMLEKCFLTIKNPTLRPVVMHVMKHINNIPEDYLKKLLEDPNLYKESATEVKRQIWRNNQSLFGDEVSPLLSQYIKEKDTLLFSLEPANSNNFFTPAPKSRRQGEVVQKLMHMIGRDVKLYDMVLQFLRTLFLRTRNVHYCTLRAELLMALHDTEVHEICSVDPCHKFTWCLDACIRERFIDAKRARELQGFLDGVKRGQEQVLGDLSMILCDPYAVNTVASSSLKVLQHLVAQESLPRDSPELSLLLRMLSLGLGAWEMIDSQVFKEPKPDNEVITKFLPALMGLMVEDQVRLVAKKLSENHKNSTIPKTFAKSIRQHGIAAILTLYYLYNVTKHRNKDAIMHIIPKMTDTHNDLSLEDPFVHLLVSLLISMAEEFSSEDFCSAVFDNFFLVVASREGVRRHLLRLLWFLHPKLPTSRLAKLQTQLEPTKEHSEAVHKQFSALADKINSYTPSPAHDSPALESPLMSVPTPAPL